MTSARISALLEPFLDASLSQFQLDQISTYIDLLLRWNARINLTAIRREDEIVTRHFGESLFLARHLFSTHAARPLLSATARSAQPQGNPTPPQSLRVLDIGSGAGFPGLPLKIWAPAIHLILVESNHKKAAFLREAARALTLTNVDVITDRAEVLAARLDFPRTQVVTLRAVERFDSILPQAIALLAPPATLALLIGTAQVATLATAPDLKCSTPIPVPNSNSRVLSICVPQ
jgi:16S rRNA (guanine527-N7)-methyltransferase